MTGNLETCPKCGMPKRAKTAASITQWIMKPDACNCDAVAGSNTQPATYCPNCGKTVIEERKGSLTQWIMAQSICKCGKSETRSSASRPPREYVEETVPTNEDEDEIELDPNRFPTHRYKPLRELGKGGAGAVFLCRDRLLKKLVAVKVLHELTAEQLVSFQTEAKAIANIKHPGIVELLDFGPTPSGLPYMVLEYFDGISLHDHLAANGPMDEETALVTFIYLAEGLALSHSNGVYHRDVSSSNVLVRITGPGELDIKLIDFGVAHVHDEGVDNEQQGLTLAGTPAYMSPDNANGLPFDARSEIYSLGCMLFETLTGHVPFLGRSAMETINMHATAPPPTLADKAGKSFTPELETIVSICLAKEKDDRFQSMHDLLQALIKAGGGFSHDEQASAARPSQPPSKSRNLLIPLAVAIVLLTSIAYMLMYYLEPPKEESPKSAPAPNTRMFHQNEMYEDGGEMEVLEEKVGMNTAETDTLIYAAHVTTKEQLAELAASHPLGTTVRFFECAIDESMLELIESNPNWVQIRIASTKISPQLMTRWFGNKRIQTLGICDTPINGDVVKALSTLPLRGLDLENVGLTDKDIPYISKLNQLLWLNLSKNPDVSRSALQEISKLPKVDTLVLMDSKLAGDDLKWIASMQTISCLRIAGCGPFTAVSLSELERLPLRRLDLSNTGLGLDELEFLAKFKKLRELDIRDNKSVDESTLKLFSNRPSLHIIVDKQQVDARRLYELSRSLGVRLGLSKGSVRNFEIFEDAKQ